MGNLAPGPFKKLIPAPLIKSVELSRSDVNPSVTKMNIEISLQLVKRESSSPFGLCVMLINKGSVVELFKKKKSTVRHQIINKGHGPPTVLKKYIGIEDFVTDGTIKHLINTREGLGVVTKDVSVEAEIMPTKDQNLWIYAVTYELNNEEGGQKALASPQSSHFSMSDAVIEPVLISGHAPVTSYLYILNDSAPGFGEAGDVWVGPVYRRGRKFLAGNEHTKTSPPTLRRTKVSNQKIRDLRMLSNIEDLNLDNFSVNMKNINKKNFKNYRAVKKMMGKKYFSRLYYSRALKGDYRLFFSMDYDAFINDHSRFANLFTNKDSLKSCFQLNDISVYRRRKNNSRTPSQLAGAPKVEEENSLVESPIWVGSLEKGQVSTIESAGSEFFNFIISDGKMSDEPLSAYKYQVSFEFIDNSALVVKHVADKLQKTFIEFQSFMSKFEGLDKKDFDIQEYLRVNAKVIKSDDAWLRLINEFISSIWFLFGKDGFGDQAPIVWKKNLTTMINPMSATMETFNEFVETIQEYIKDLYNVVQKSAVGQSEKKFSARSKISSGKDLIRKIKYTHEPRAVYKRNQNGIGFDYLGHAANSNTNGLVGVSFGNLNRRINQEIQKYKVGNPNNISINKYGFLSPSSIHTSYETMSTRQYDLELSDGLTLLDSNVNPSVKEFTAAESNATVATDMNAKLTKMMCILGSAAVTIEPLEETLVEFVQAQGEPQLDETLERADNLFSPNLALDNSYLEAEVSGSDEFKYLNYRDEKRQMQVYDADLSERLVDGVSREFVSPRVRRFRFIKGSLAADRMTTMGFDAFVDLNSFMMDINFNSLIRIEYLDGYHRDNIRSPKWAILTQIKFNDLRTKGESIICRLRSLPSVTYPGDKYKLSPVDYLFVLGDDQTDQTALTRPSFKQRLDYYYRRMQRLDKSWTTNINRSAANYGSEYYVSTDMIYHTPHKLQSISRKMTRGSFRYRMRRKRRGREDRDPRRSGRGGY
tara:strand:+ start:550 stop:3504 length:2955 start_codon:yes stop_codon:yes gene_type:complete